MWRFVQLVVGGAGVVLAAALAVLAYARPDGPLAAALDLAPPVAAWAAPWAWPPAAIVSALILLGPSVVRRRRRRAAIEMRLAPAPPPVAGRSAPRPTPPAPYPVHAPAPPEPFVGREEARRALTAWFRAGKGPPVALVTGAAGIGKTALAWTWLRRDVLGEKLPGVATVDRAAVGARGRPRGVLWWSFDRPGAGFAALLDEAVAYLTSGAVRPGGYLSSRSEKVDNLLALLREGRHLLVLDAFESQLRRGEDGPDARRCADVHTGDFLRQAVREGLAGRVLVLSRDAPVELEETAGACARLEVNGLEPVEAAALLTGLGAPDDGEEATAAACGGHPLALRLAAREGGARSRRPAGGAAAPAEVVEAALDALDAGAAALLSHLAVFGRPVTTAEAALFEPGGEPRRREDALRTLVARGLLREDDGLLHVHSLVRRAAYARLAAPRDVHAHLADHFAQARLPAGGGHLEQLAPALEQYRHLLGAGREDEAYALLSGRLAPPLRDRLGDLHALVRLLAALFDGAAPRLRDPAARAWAVDTLARACSYCGETRRAATLCERNLPALDAPGTEDAYVAVLGTAAGVQTRLGRLEAGEASLRRLVETAARRSDAVGEATARNRLGLLLAHRGAFDDALAQLDTAFELVRQAGGRQTQGVCFCYYARRALLLRDHQAALDAARKARAIVEECARRDAPDEHDYVRSGWLLAAACIARADACTGEERTGHLDEAERYLADARSRCRRNDLVGFAADLLLTRGRWSGLAGRPGDAGRFARQALAVAQRCEYRLTEADAHNFLAELALREGDRDGALASARAAWECAFCDGPPFSYTPALDEAERLLGELGAGDDAPPREARAA